MQRLSEIIEGLMPFLIDTVTLEDDIMTKDTTLLEDDIMTKDTTLLEDDYASDHDKDSWFSTSEDNFNDNSDSGPNG